MAHGSNAYDGKKTYYVKFRGLKKDSPDKPHIQAEEKVGTSYVPLEEKWGFIEGRITRAEVGVFSWEGKDNKTFKLTFEDEENRYVLDSSYSMVGVSLVNSLLSLEEFGLINVGIYLNKSGYPALSVKNNGEKVNWKHDPEFLKSKKEPIKNKKGEVIQYDDAELVELLEQEFKGWIIPRANAVVPSSAVHSEAKQEESQEETLASTNQPSEETMIEKIKKGKKLKEKAEGKEDDFDDLPF